MKKVWLVVALSALGGLAANTFADVQNIRLSGDIRVRGYYFADAAEDEVNTGGTDGFQDETMMIAQRTRVCVEADLEDHVLVVVTLKAEGLWGASSDTGTAGAGNEDDAGGAIGRTWAVGVSEAYVQLNELFYSPATLKLGRQHLNYGRGLIISSTDQEYNFDAGRLVLDFYPFTLDIVGARVLDQGVFGPDTPRPSANMLFVNGRYEMNTDAAKVNLEGYIGYLSQSVNGGATSLTAPPSAGGASPIVLGARADVNVTGVNLWFEGAYETGDGGALTPTKISAWLLNAGFKAGCKDTALTPSINGSYTYASGGGNQGGKKNFVPWFDYTDGGNGYLFAPMLSNIHIFNLGGSIKPAENLSLALQVFYYLKADPDSTVGSNVNIDFGGLEFAREGPQTADHEVGWEIDAVAGYDYSKDVRLQLVYGMFLPGDTYANTTAVDSVAHLVRGEVNVKF